MVVPLMPFSIAYCGVTDIGCVRQKNEDVWDHLAEENFFVLADGMGGHRAGDVASKETVRALLRVTKRRLAELPEERHTCQEVARLLRLAIEEVNRLVYDLSKSEEEWRGMGTTLCCLHLQQEGIVYGHVGDSRIYRYRSGVLKQLTDDHSLLREMIQRGQVQDQPRDTCSYKNVITKAIGTEPVVEPSINVTDIQDHDIILMCSDGLSDLASTEDMCEILTTSSSLRKAADNLVSLAKARGGTDNITVVLVKANSPHEDSDLSR